MFMLTPGRCRLRRTRNKNVRPACARRHYRSLVLMLVLCATQGLTTVSLGLCVWRSGKRARVAISSRHCPLQVHQLKAFFHQQACKKLKSPYIEDSLLRSILIYSTQLCWCMLMITLGQLLFCYHHYRVYAIVSFFAVYNSLAHFPLFYTVRVGSFGVILIRSWCIKGNRWIDSDHELIRFFNAPWSWISDPAVRTIYVLGENSDSLVIKLHLVSRASFISLCFIFCYTRYKAYVP